MALQPSLFLSARPGRGATPAAARTPKASCCFYPRAPGGARRGRRHRARSPSCGFYPRAPGGARRVQRIDGHDVSLVSIRAPRAGRDATPSSTGGGMASFYPRAPGGARPRARPWSAPYGVSIRAPRAGRDPRRARAAHCLPGFYPRAPGGARRARIATLINGHAFLSARPGRGATRSSRREPRIIIQFLSARPGRGATRAPIGDPPQRAVSIRAPRAGRDAGCQPDVARSACFYPRAPGGARLFPYNSLIKQMKWSSSSEPSCILDVVAISWRG